MALEMNLHALILQLPFVMSFLEKPPQKFLFLTNLPLSIHWELLSNHTCIPKFYVTTIYSKPNFLNKFHTFFTRYHFPDDQGSCAVLFEFTQSYFLVHLPYQDNNPDAHVKCSKRFE